MFVYTIGKDIGILLCAIFLVGKHQLKNQGNIIETRYMKKLLLLASFLLATNYLPAQIPDSVNNNIAVIKKYIYSNYKGMFRKPVGILKYPFITPGSSAYANDLWDWDSWLSNIALRQILQDQGTDKDKAEAVAYERGCILNYLEYTGFDGYMPILISKNKSLPKLR